jgi:prophage regulatory protein
MRMLSFPDLKAEKGIRFTRQHIHRLVRQKRFPAPVKLGQQTNAWIETEVDKFLEDCIAKRDTRSSKENAA